MFSQSLPNNGENIIQLTLLGEEQVDDLEKYELSLQGLKTKEQTPLKKRT